jgi:hypothetical protein
MMGITYCSQTKCVQFDCLRHQLYAPKDRDISIADLNDGLCFDPGAKAILSDRERLLTAICKGTQKTNYKCDTACKAMCGSDGSCAYCSIIADAIEKEFATHGTK